MAQGGDIIFGNGTGSVSIYGATFPDETFDLPLARRGELAMAPRGPHGNGCQFFLSLDSARFLEGSCVVFGHVLAGAEALRRLEAAGTASGAPSAPVTIARSGQLEWEEDEKKRVR